MMETINLAQKEIEEVLKKYGLQMGYKLQFPIYNILPEEVRLALKVLEKHGMVIVLNLKPKK